MVDHIKSAKNKYQIFKIIIRKNSLHLILILNAFFRDSIDDKNNELFELIKNKNTSKYNG